MHRQFAFVLFLTLAVILNYTLVFAEAPDEDIINAGALEKKLTKKREEPPEIIIKERLEAQKPKPALPAEKIPIQQINVVKVTLLTQKEIEAIILPYKNKELTGVEMLQCADLITEAYGRKGYIASYTYIIGTERLKEGILEIMAVEGKIGKIEIKGNRYFSTSLLRKEITLKEGQPFNFIQLHKDIYSINKYPDRSVRFELELDEEPGIINIILWVKDRSPLHLTFEADNYESQNVLYKRYKTYFTHNNLTGHDDALTAKVQIGEADSQKLYDLDYYIPISDNWEFELYIMPYKFEDFYGENEEKDLEKKARKAYFYFYQYLIYEPNCQLMANYGFVYKDIFWYSYGNRNQQDKFRALLAGFEFNRADRYGRSVITDELEMGIPRMWGGSAAKDDSCSIKSAGGGYKTNHLILARRNKLFKEIELLFKSHWQLSSQTLTGVNAFNVGGFEGAIDMRGYPRSEAVGDSGTSITTGFSFPPFFLSKNLKVPFSQAKFYDALKLITFYDWARAILKSPKASQKKTATLKSAGFAFIFALPEDFSLRLDLGWPLGNKYPKDGDGFHSWFKVTKGF